MPWLTYLGLCLAGLTAVIVELFVPAAGIIGIVGFGSMVAGVVLAYSHYGVTVGTAYLIGVVVATPLILALYFKIFPRSIIGRWLILGQSRTQDTDVTVDEPEKEQTLIGSEGTAFTALRPSGTAAIDGRKYSVVTAGEFIEKGEPVVVKHVAGTRIVVRRIGGDV